MTTIKTKYSLKNESGNYDVLHFETSAEQVLENENKQFVNQEEKTKLNKVSDAIGDYKIWTGTKTEYDQISQKDNNTLYFVKEV